MCAGTALGRGAGGGRASVLVFEADDVVFAEVVTTLDFDQMQIRIGRILQPVQRFDRNVRRFVAAEQELFVADRTLAVPVTTVQCSLRR